MKIKKLTATFGGLDGAELAPGPGLTVITAPNEGGKSTWAAFWRAMLYGIDTRERDKAGFLADKNHYVPWSGAPMAGELQAEWKGQEITVRRFATSASIFGGFQAVYTASGDTVPGLTAKSVGEALTGAGREVYLRSAFVDRSGAFLGQNNELEARISALATTGQEDVSFSATQRTLKSWRNRRRLNRSSGQIPKLQGAIARTDEVLEQVNRERERQENASAQVARLRREESALSGVVARWAQLERLSLNRRYRQALAEAERAAGELDALAAPEAAMEGWSAQRAVEWADRHEREYEEARRNREAALARRMELEQRAKTPAMVLLLLTVLFAAAGLFGAVLNVLGLLPLNPALFAVPLLGAIAASFLRGRAQARTAKKLEALDVPPEPERSAWQERARRHMEYLTQKERLEGELRHARMRAEDFAALGAEDDGGEDAPPAPAMEKSQAEARLDQTRQAIQRWQGEIAQAQGALAQLGDPVELEEQRGELQARLDRRFAEYDALTVAMDALSEANDILRQRLSPALNRWAGQIFSSLTGGRWTALTLARDFSAQATQADSPIPRPAPALSAGTMEQLYLAVRLSICELALPDAPIFLDDALCAFDDARMALALEFLAELGQGRQVLLFSCRGREAEWARAHGVPVLDLT